jgi:hypothetical protein
MVARSYRAEAPSDGCPAYGHNASASAPHRLSASPPPSPQPRARRCSGSSRRCISARSASGAFVCLPLCSQLLVTSLRLLHTRGRRDVSARLSPLNDTFVGPNRAVCSTAVGRKPALATRRRMTVDSLLQSAGPLSSLACTPRFATPPVDFDHNARHSAASTSARVPVATASAARAIGGSAGAATPALCSTQPRSFSQQYRHPGDDLPQRTARRDATG